MPSIPQDVVRRTLPGAGTRPQIVAPPGVLATIGRILDYPGRFIRRGLTGLEDPSGRDVLERMGILGANKPGLDLGDVAGFAAEVALDPLTYVGGVGALTKGGKVATRGLELQRNLRALRAARQTATNPEARKLALEGIQETRQALKAVRAEAKAVGTPFKLGKTAREQAARGQRALLSMGLPFREGRPVVKGGAVLGALEAAGRATGATKAVKGLRAAFDPRTFRAGGKVYDRSQEAKPFFELAEQERSGAILQGGKEAETIRAAGIEDPRQFSRVRESLGVPGRVARAVARLRKQREDDIAEAFAMGKLLDEKRAVPAVPGAPPKAGIPQRGEVVPWPTEKIRVDPVRFQFKGGGDPKTGVTKQLPGKYEPEGTPPLLGWRDRAGEVWLVHGHHRHDLARRSGTKEVPLQLIDEVRDAVTDKEAMALGAMYNIRDGFGELEDFAKFFRNTAITEQEALGKGLLRNVTSRAGFTLGRNASPDVYSAWLAGALDEKVALALSRGAPGDVARQAAGLKFALGSKKKRPAEEVEAFVGLLGRGTKPSGGGLVQGDIFGFDDAAIREAEAMAKVIARRKATISKRLAAKGAVRRPEEAAELGVDVKDVAASKGKIAELEAARAALEPERLVVNAELLNAIRAEAKLEPIQAALRLPAAAAPSPASVAPDIFATAPTPPPASATPAPVPPPAATGAPAAGPAYGIFEQPLTAEDAARMAQLRQAIGPKYGRRINRLQKRGDLAEYELRTGAEYIPEAERLKGQLGDLLGQEVRSGARDPRSRMDSVVIEYAERVLTPEAKAWLRETGQEEAFYNRLVKKATTRTGSQIGREDKLREVLTDEADQFFQKAKGLEGHWFEFDPAKSFPQRYVSGKISIANAKLFTGLADSFGRVPHVPGQTMKVSEFLAKGPLHRWRGMTLPAEAEAIERKLAKAGIGGRGIPMDIAQEALEIHRKLSAPEEVGALLTAVDAATALWRTSLTIPFPAFHFRNLLSDTQLSWLGGGANPRMLPEAFKLFRDPAWLERMEKLGVLKGTQARAVLEGIGATEKRGKFLERLYERFPRVGAAAEKSGKLAGAVENFTRTWHFLSMKAKGFTDLEAARSVRRWLLDYSSLTDFERQVMKRAIFFYQWPRKVLPLLTKSFFTETGRAALLTRLAAQPSQQPDVPVPEFLRQTAALPSPFGPGPGGEPRFIAGIGSPFEEFQKLDVTSPEGGVLGGMRKLARTVGTNLTPALRIPAELATGRDLYFDRDIIRGDYAEPLYGLPGLRELLGVEEQTLPGGGKRLRGDPLALYLLRASPASRFATAAGDLGNVVGGIDPRTGRGEDLARFLTGIRSIEVGEDDQARAAQETIRRLLSRLVREGKAGEKRINFALGPEGEKDPEALGLIAEERAIGKLLERLRGR